MNIKTSQYCSMDILSIPSDEAPTNKNIRQNYHNFMVKSVLKILTDSQRKYIMDYYITGNKMKDIAEKNNISVATVSRTIKRGISRIKKYAEIYYN